VADAFGVRNTGHATGYSTVIRGPTGIEPFLPAVDCVVCCRARAYFSTAGAITTVVVSGTAAKTAFNGLPTSGPFSPPDHVMKSASSGLDDHVAWQGLWVLLLGRESDTQGLRVTAATSGRN
jgi:hypothetical protein